MGKEQYNLKIGHTDLKNTIKLLEVRTKMTEV